MKSKILSLLALPAAGFVALAAIPSRSADGAAQDRSCCVRDPQALVCGITGETIPSCCCEEKDGRLVCGKTGEALASCCCSPASGPNSSGQGAPR